MQEKPKDTYGLREVSFRNICRKVTARLPKEHGSRTERSSQKEEKQWLQRACKRSKTRLPHPMQRG